jgi:uncharacterized membrane protein
MFILFFYVAIRLGQVHYLIIDKEMKVLDSFKQSWKITKGHAVILFMYSLIFGIISLIASYTVIGVLVTFPIISIANILIYRKLISSENKRTESGKV